MKVDMNIALFAGDWVGDQVVKIFRESDTPLAGLVIDSRNPRGLNESIISHSKLGEDAVFESDTLSDEHALNRLESLNLDLIVLAWWPYIIKRRLIEIPRLGCLNFHPSLLPHNRGKHPNFWTLFNEAPAGVTIHWVNEGVDSGDIAFQSILETTWEDTGQTLYVKAQAAMLKLFKDNFLAIKRGEIPRIPQNLSEGSFYKAQEITAASRIDLEQTYKARDLLNLIRARTFPPHPGAWFMDGPQESKYEVRIDIVKVPDE